MMITDKKIKRSEFLKLTGVGASMFVLSSLPFTSKIEAKGSRAGIFVCDYGGFSYCTIFSTAKRMA